MVFCRLSAHGLLKYSYRVATNPDKIQIKDITVEFITQTQAVLVLSNAFHIDCCK